MAKAAKKLGKGAPKKRWIEILAPKVFNELPVGQTYVYETRQGIGKTINVNLMSLTNNHKRQGTNVTFEVTGQRDDKLTTDFIGLRIMPPVVKRMVRRGKLKMEDSFMCSTLDGKKVRIKPVIVTKSKAKGVTAKLIRKLVKNYMIKSSSKMAYDKLVESIVDYKLQKGAYDEISKITPVSVCEIRWFQLLKKKNSGEEEQPAETEKQDAPKAEA